MMKARAVDADLSPLYDDKAEVTQGPVDFIYRGTSIRRTAAIWRSMKQMAGFKVPPPHLALRVTETVNGKPHKQLCDVTLQKTGKNGDNGDAPPLFENLFCVKEE